MQYTTLLKQIDTYEMAMMDKNLSVTDWSKYMGTISTSREKLFYSLADLAVKNKKLKSVLLDEAMQFVQFESCLLANNHLSSEQFYTCLTSINSTYENMQEFDDNNTLRNTIYSRLNNVIKILHAQHSEQVNSRVNEIYNLLLKIREQKQLKN